MDRKIIFLVALLLILPLALAIPEDLNINGKLTDSNGYPLDGTYSMTFKIYDVPSGGSVLYTVSGQSVTTDSDGVFTTILSGVDLDFSSDYYLGIAVGADSEMTPRVNLTSSGYAFRARNVSIGGVEFDSDVDAGDKNITTTGWFRGLFNWIVGSGSESYLDFNGSELNFDEAKLNATIDTRAGGIGTFVPYTGATGDVDLGDNNFSVGTSDFFVDNSLGRVGIGTASPWAALDIISTTRQLKLGYNSSIYTSFTVSSTGTLGIEIPNYLVLSPKYLHFNPTELTYTSKPLKIYDNTALNFGTGSDYSIGYDNVTDLFQVVTGPNVGTDVRLVIDTNGNVGIGTTTPTAKLHVNGSINVTTGNDVCTDDGVCLSSVGTSAGGWTRTGTELSPTNTGDNVSVGTSDFFVDNSNGRVGIGTSSPGAKLQVNGNNSESSIAAHIVSGNGAATRGLIIDGDGEGGDIPFAVRVAVTPSSITDADTKFMVNYQGNVGIGTTTPSHELNVVGDTNITGTLYVNGEVISSSGAWSTAGSDIYYNSGNVGIGTTSPDGTLGFANGGDIYFKNTAGTGVNVMTLHTDNNLYLSTGNDIVFRTTNTSYLEKMRITSSGNVGIGTTSPGAKLEVAGDVKIGVDNTANSGILEIARGAKTSYIVNDHNPHIYTTDSTFDDLMPAVGLGNLIIQPRTSNDAIGSIVLATRENDTSVLPRMVVLPGGNVGIGTTSPTAKLHVNGSINVTTGNDICTDDGVCLSSVGTSAGGWTRTGTELAPTNTGDNVSVGGTDFFVDNSNGRVGIGTSSPEAKLEVAGDVHFPKRYINDTSRISSPGNIYTQQEWDVLTIGDNDHTDYSASAIRFLARAGDTTTRGTRLIQNADNFEMWTGSGGQNLVMAIDNGGNVGIGTATPSQKLNVNGSINISGSGAVLYFSDGTNMSTAGGAAGSYVPYTGATGNVDLGSYNFTTTGLIRGRFGTLLESGNYAYTKILETAYDTTLNRDVLRLYTAGEGADNANAKVTIVNNGNVGIGTTSPSQKLDVNGSINISRTGASLIFPDGTTLNSNSSLGGGNANYQFGNNNFNGSGNFTTSGRVGIGTAEPRAKLEVAGEVSIISGEKALVLGGDYDANTLTTNTNHAGRLGFYHYDNSEQPVAAFLGTSTSTSNGLSIGGGSSYFNAVTLLSFYTAPSTTTLIGTERMRITNSGNVGIGTTTPTAKLHVNGSINVTTGNDICTDDGVCLSSVGTSAGGWTRTGTLLAPTNAGDNVSVGTSDFFVDNSNGRVGIGTASPGSLLEVNGSFIINSSGTGGNILVKSGSYNLLNINGATLSMQPYPTGTPTVTISNYGSDWNLRTLIASSRDATNSYPHLQLQPNGGNVGIGTDSPGAKLHIADDTVSGTPFLVNTATGGQARWAMIAAGDPTSRFTLQARKSDGSATVSIDPSGTVYFNTGGNVGIGTTTPTAKLHVNGSINVTTGNDICTDDGVCLSSVGTSAGGWTRTGTELAPTNTGDNVSVGGTDLFVDNSNGRVGIGTDSPGAPLQIGVGGADNNLLYRGLILRGGYSTTTQRQQNLITFIGTSASNADPFDDTGSETFKNVHMGLLTDTSYYNSARFSIIGNGTEYLSILTGGSNKGNVGIGTTSPSSKLHIDDVENTIIQRWVSEGRSLALTTPNASDGASPWKWNTANSYEWNTDGNPRMVISSTGNVGIGTITPSKKFEVNGTAGGLTIDVDDASEPTINTTAGNVTITSSGGSVIVRLG